jgi:asparagine synthase (glutamine-hydrolysing)
MSGFVCIFNRDGEPVDQALLQKLTDSLSYRGPHGKGIHLDGQIGMGHTLLITTEEHAREKQPFTFDGNLWIVADARVDDRDRLKRELISKGRADCEQATDVELLLHAYIVWGKQCVDHLLGDFSFVIWNSATRLLFCARDHIGFKLLYYTEIGRTVILSNELNCIRKHPLVTDTLNDLAIADFLLFWFNQDLTTTTFADIHRMAPASSVTITTTDIRHHRYWVLPHDTHMRFKNPQDYIDRFHELLEISLNDRIRLPEMASLMSGGLDSPTIAAAAKKVISQNYATFDLRAYTIIYEHIIPDDEKYYAGLAADKIGIPIQFLVADDFPLRLGNSIADYTVPEPFHWDALSNLTVLSKSILTFTSVALDGEDGDALLLGALVFQLVQAQGFWLTTRDVISYWWQYKKRPHFGLGLLHRVKKHTGRKIDEWKNSYPEWINPDFERHYRLKERWYNYVKPRAIPPKTMRPEGYRRLTSPFWQVYTESLDASVTSIPIEYRLPFMDIRLISYLLGIPSLPWGQNKELLRRAGRGLLPDEVVQRPKTPMQSEPILARVQARPNLLQPFLPAKQLSDYVLISNLKISFESFNNAYHRSLNIIYFNEWLKRFRLIR